MFQKKEPTEKELREGLQRVGITTKSDSGREEKFGAFRTYAQERASQRQGLAPVNPYANMNASLVADLQSGGNPYGQKPDNGEFGAGNGYSGAGNRQNPYLDGSIGVSGASRGGSSAYGRGSAALGSAGAAGAAGASRRPNPYERSSSRSNPTRDDELTLDLNDIPSIAPPVRMKMSGQGRSCAYDEESLDLNELPGEEDLNVEVDDFLPEQEQVNSEDEEVEAIKQDIRFTKQESLALTRNTLRMAQEADASGINTLGMLGSQSERLYNAEQNLLLADTQTKIAEEKVKYLKKLNRSIFVPVAVGNPFNKKSKLRQQEQKLKTEKQQEKYLRETNRQGVYASEQRVKEGITNSSTTSDTFNKYQGEKYLGAAQRYQFENDSEDDEMEKELGSNLDQIHAFSKKLKNTATVIGQEVEAQNSRLRRIEEDADRLDINVHLNSARLGNIR